MSSVRMCDRCGAIFSEREDAWQSFTATNVRRNRETGKKETVTEALDACPKCALGGPATDPPAPRFADATTNAKELTSSEAREAHIKDLEHEVLETPIHANEP